jgi:molybdopterin/thiamine biosynthesis adenylyltransferase
MYPVLWQRCESRVVFSFWQSLRDRILNDWRLTSSSKKHIHGFVSQTLTTCIVEVRDASFQESPDGTETIIKGDLILCNTAHEFKMRDKQALLNETEADFCLLIYPNIKENVFVYWFAFPTDVIIGGDGCGGGFTPTTVRDCVSWRVLEDDDSERKPDIVLPLKIYKAPHEGSYSFPWFARRTMARFVTTKTDAPTDILVQHTCGKLRLGYETIPDGGRPTVIGWEADTHGAMCPRRADLRAVYDTTHIADEAARLNLELMRWRMLPELDLRRIESTRCLLLGAGTLGCHIARDLLAWGVRHITFVDAGRVAYSNPVRQPLFEHSDATKECWKAQAAAEALKRIHPSAVTAGHVLRIPMPGHPVHDTERADVTRDIEALRRLIREHDVVFLLTDTRESRWLPTLLARVEGRLAITVALGFDSWLVMRHTRAGGCYFCLDCLAPKNTTLNRTLDQQCTVTRPGVAPIASAVAVELFIALLHHPAQWDAPSTHDTDITSPTPSPLGAVPYVIRGFLSHFQTMISSADCSKYCAACSDAVYSAFIDDGMNFLWRVFDDDKELETRVGLTEMTEDAIKMVEMEDFP